jgi:hypothetical protein
MWGSIRDSTVMAKEDITMAERKRRQFHKTLEKRYDPFLQVGNQTVIDLVRSALKNTIKL